MAQSVRCESKMQPELINVKRNPYLKDYEEQRKLRELAGRRTAGGRNVGGEHHGNRQAAYTSRPEQSASKVSQRERARAAAARRKRIVRHQRIAVGLWAFCILILFVIFMMGKSKVSAIDHEEQSEVGGSEPVSAEAANSGESLVQGLPATVFAAHPDWTENFLTLNEYSRPGDSLERVDNIFVHYTANPGTSAAQNRSYFEQQKDTHERSVSAHFIIGYEGEIIQCIPLDEIAYAVQTRNEDSISIECCFLAEDGSFTQRTYDSLIGLLAWLAESYDLDTEDILRHYDCGGKKCPLYYTENPDEWERLKEDVAEQMKD